MNLKKVDLKLMILKRLIKEEELFMIIKLTKRNLNGGTKALKKN